MDIVNNLAIVAAVARNGVIGKCNKLPWKLSTDLQYFSRLTTGHTVIVGRNTHQSIIKRLGHPLSNRRTIIISTSLHYDHPDCLVVPSFTLALEISRRDKHVFAIGGFKVYQEALPKASHLFITRVLAEPDGDVFFPPYSNTDWKLFSSAEFKEGAKNEFPFRFEVYNRKEKQ
ncbi:MAG: dihydrofolate reductase [bacterium]|nr:dihydrofolate reductase [bacterium]